MPATALDGAKWIRTPLGIVGPLHFLNPVIYAPGTRYYLALTSEDKRREDEAQVDVRTTAVVEGFSETRTLAVGAAKSMSDLPPYSKASRWFGVVDETNPNRSTRRSSSPRCIVGDYPMDADIGLVIEFLPEHPKSADARAAAHAVLTRTRTRAANSGLVGLLAILETPDHFLVREGGFAPLGQVFRAHGYKIQDLID